jgi:hypothetical protein
MSLEEIISFSPMSSIDNTSNSFSTVIIYNEEYKNSFIEENYNAEKQNNCSLWWSNIINLFSWSDSKNMCI